MKKKRNLVTANLSDPAMLCLQKLGYMNKLKKSTGLNNLSQFISRLILEKVQYSFPLDYKKIMDRIVSIKLYDLQKQRDELDDQINNLVGQKKELKVMEVNNGR